MKSLKEYMKERKELLRQRYQERELLLILETLPINTTIRRTFSRASENRWAVSYLGGPKYYGENLLEALKKMLRSNKKVQDKMIKNQVEKEKTIND